VKWHRMADERPPDRQIRVLLWNRRWDGMTYGIFDPQSEWLKGYRPTHWAIPEAPEAKQRRKP